MRRQSAKLLLQLSILLAFSLACGPIDLAREILSQLPTATPESAYEIRESYHWYIETDGEDTPPCDALAPCRTLNYVLGRATDDDRIFIGEGRFVEPDPQGSGVTHRIADLRLTIEGAGRDATFIIGDGSRSVFFISGTSRINLIDLTVENGGGRAPGNCIEHRGDDRVTLENVTVQNCYPGGIGNGIGGEMRLTDVTVRDAREVDEFGGGGISNGGTMIINGGRVYNNDRTGVGSVGSLDMTGTVLDRNGLEGLVINGGTAIVRDVTVMDNAHHPTLFTHHPGVVIEREAEAEFFNLHVDENEACVSVFDTAVVTINDSLIEGCDETGLTVNDMADVTLVGTTIQNTGSRYAGTSIAAGVDNSGSTTLRGVIIRDTANGGIANYGNLTLEDTLVTGNRGHMAALYNNPGASAEVRSSLIHNYLGDQPAIDNRGTLIFENSTVSGNPNIGISAVSGTLTLLYATITNNGEYGLAAGDAAEVLGTIANSVIVDNSFGDCYLGSFPPSSIGGGALNIDSDGSCRVGTTYDIAALMLQSLADNGGPTQTHALLIDSPAVDAASGSCPGADQRGAGRPFGGGCDMGAYEFNPTFGATAASLEVTGTPPAVGELPTVNTDSLCTLGPGPGYSAVQTIEQGVLVELVGRGIEGGWWIVDSPRFPGLDCWLPEANVDVPLALDVGALPSIPIPPLPTPTGPAAPPQAPQQLSLGQVVCDGQNYTVQLLWMDAASTEDGYRIYRDGQLIDTLGANATQYTDGDAPATGSSVTYGVEAFNTIGASSRPEVVEPGCLF